VLEIVTQAVGFVPYVTSLCLLSVPALTALHALERRIGRARPGSLLDLRDRRAIWLAAFSIIALVSIAVAALTPWHNPLAIVTLSSVTVFLSCLWDFDPWAPLPPMGSTMAMSHALFFEGRPIERSLSALRGPHHTLRGGRFRLPR